MRPYRVYQKIVAEIAASMNPGAEVKEGQWVTGPDGRRDLDVVIRGGLHSGRTVKIMIECKDWKRKVGIETIDALESKRRDLAADVAFICSNSGFTKEARRKAGRVGICPITILQHGDQRIRSEIEFDLYVAHVTISNNRTYSIHFATPVARPNRLNLDEVTIHDRGFCKLFESDLLFKIVENLEFNSILMRCRFKEPIPMVVDFQTYMIAGVDVKSEFTVSWRMDRKIRHITRCVSLPSSKIGVGGAG